MFAIVHAHFEGPCLDMDALAQRAAQCSGTVLQCSTDAGSEREAPRHGVIAFEVEGPRAPYLQVLEDAISFAEVLQPLHSQLGIASLHLHLNFFSSVQGNTELPARLLARLGALGCDLALTCMGHETS